MPHPSPALSFPRAPAPTRGWLFVALAIVLVLVRLPSLAEPAGADQGLYGYVGQRILDGGVPYRDAWDQKPPAIHYTYAVLFALWSNEAVINIADLAAVIGTAWGLYVLGRGLAPLTPAGPLAALLFLFLGNPALGRLGGVRVRGQCEVFIALFVTLGLAAIWRACRDADIGARRLAAGWVATGGALVGLTFLYKYNAGVYLVPAVILLVTEARDQRVARSDVTRGLTTLIAAFALPIVLALAWFWWSGALRDLYAATISYNAFYSGETYDGPLSFARYLVTFPVRHAWLDSLWWMGGLGTVALLLMSPGRPSFLAIAAWVAAACVSIAVNGSRGLPQYFAQAAPALALAAAVPLAAAWVRSGAGVRVAIVVLVSIGIWRVSNVVKVGEYARHDVQYLTGRMNEDTFLAKFGEPASDAKYSALALRDLARELRARTAPADKVLVFGFSPGALVQAPRVSATRFFWSRPVIVGFGEGVPGYGRAGLLQELDAAPPALVVLQDNDWHDTADSLTWFTSQPALASWLNAGYDSAGSTGNYHFWTRRQR